MHQFYPVLFRLSVVFPIVFTLLQSVEAQCPITVNAGEDIFLCAPPAPTQLDGSISGNFLNFSWSPTTGMTGANSLTPTVNVSTTTSYVLRARAIDPGLNLIVNGDFEQGNTGFSSDYVYNPGFSLPPFGTYEVTAFPAIFPDCPDHTSGSGNYMVVDGAEVPNLFVWCQTVTVQPNTTYNLSAWATSLTGGSPLANLEFTINGTVVGGLAVNNQVCTWQGFNINWNSGNNTSATICIEDLTVTGSNNDFAIDDIAFAPLCEVTDTVTVHVINLTAVASPAQVILPCAGAQTTLNGNGSSTGPNVSYLWETDEGNIVSGQTTLTPVIDQPGLYTLTVTYDYGTGVCTKTATVNVILSPSPLSVFIAPHSPLGCGSSTVNLIGIASQGNVSFAWSTPDGNIVSGASGNIAVVDQPGTYNLLVTNNVTGCTAEASTTVTLANNPPTAIAGGGDTLTCLITQTTLSGTGSSTGSTISYLWTTIGGQLLSGQNTLMPIVGAPGIYILGVTNSSNNCTAFDTVTVPGNLTPPLLSLPNPGDLTCIVDTLTLTASVAPLGSSLLWTATGGGVILGDSTGLSIQVANPGVYQLTATHPVTGCTATLADTVTANTTPPVAVASTNGVITCQSPSVTVSGAGSSTGGPFTYLWTGVNIVSGADSLVAVVNAAGVYTLTVLDTLNGCSAFDTVTVTADANVVLAVATVNDTLDCTTTTVTLSGAGSTTGPTIAYSWSTTNGLILSGGVSTMPVVGAPGTYELKVTNTANGCTSTDQVVVVQDTIPPSFTILPPDTLTCVVSEVVLTAQPADSTQFYALTWTTLGGGFSGATTGWSVGANAPGLYTAVATDPVNGCTASQTVSVVTDDSSPTALANVDGPVTCFEPVRALLSTGSTTGPSITYAWSTVDGNILSGNQAPTAQVNAGGTYQLLVTNAQTGCTAVSTVFVVENTAAPVSTVAVPDSISCTNPSETLIVTDVLPGRSYSWSTIDGIILTGANTSSPTVGSAGTYVLTVTDQTNGCTFVLTVQVFNDSNAPVASIGTSDMLDCAHPEVLLPGSGSTGPQYTYQWTGPGIVSGANTLSPLVSLPGVYTLVVTNATNGCTDDASITVVQDTASPQIAIAQPQQITCAITAFNLMAEPSSGPYAYTWTASGGGNLPGAINVPNPVVNAPGIYTLTVINVQNGCTATGSATVTSDLQAPVLAMNTPGVLTCSLTSVPVGGTVTSSSSGNLLAQWTASQGGQLSGPVNALTATATQPGLYTLSVVDMQNGCDASASVTVVANTTPPGAEAGQGGTLTCSVTQTSLNGSTASGGFSAVWTGPGLLSGATTLQPVVNQPGWYTLTVTGTVNGCTSVDSVEVLSNVQQPTLVVAQPATLTCVVLTTTLNASASDAGSYVWTTTGGNLVSGASTAIATVDAPGLYLLTLTNPQNGCSSTATVNVAENTAPPTVDAGAPGVLHCNQLQTTLSGSSGASNAAFVWSTTNGNIAGNTANAQVTVNAPGTYVLTATDPQNGCTATDATTVSELPLPAFVPAVSQPDCMEPLGALAFTNVSGVGFALAYSIDGGQSYQAVSNFTNLNPGTYTMVVRDSLGCTSSETAVLNEPAYPQVSLPASVSIEIGDSTELTPTVVVANSPIALWSWLPPAGLSCADCPMPFARPLQTTFYELTVTDQDGCTGTAGIRVVVDTRRYVYAPNVFSPNDDGVNDWFTLFGNRQLVLIEALRVYDRWGNLTWEIADLEPNYPFKGWDGKAARGGETVMPGVYVWTARVRYLDGTSEVLSGDVTVVR